MEKLRIKDQMMSEEWIRQIEQSRDRQVEEANLLITQIKEGIKSIAWTGSNPNEVAVFCLNWLNSGLEPRLQPWKLSSLRIVKSDLLELKFCTSSKFEEIEVESVSWVLLEKGDSVSQFVMPNREAESVRTLCVNPLVPAPF